MPLKPDPAIRVAILDLYNNEPNEGMRAIRETLMAYNGRFLDQQITFEVFDTRYKEEVPDLGFDIYLSSGGPGSPFEGVGQAWETGYFNWLEAVWNYNQRAVPEKKHVLFICHSFQMMARFFRLALVTERRSQSFGIFPVHKTDAGRQDPIFHGLPDPFYAADFRKFQVIQPDMRGFAALGAEIIAMEKIRPYVPFERALMGIRLSPEMVGLQFHPEADPPGMSRHFRKPERKQFVVHKYGEDKYNSLLHRLEDPDFLARTHAAILPQFLREAITALRPARIMAKAG